MTDQRFVVTVQGRRVGVMEIALAVAALTDSAADRVFVEGVPGERAFVVPRALVGPPVDDMPTEDKIDRFMAAMEEM